MRTNDRRLSVPADGNRAISWEPMTGTGSGSGTQQNIPVPKFGNQVGNRFPQFHPLGAGTGNRRVIS